jgi:organic hydroperoxide reductase OsmC/OhrA
MTTAMVRTYEAEARSMDVFGRVLCQARDHYLVVDGPVWNGCPGEAVTPGELFLSAVAACAVELIAVVAREQDVAVGAVHAHIVGLLDRGSPVRSDLTVFNEVRLEVELRGVDQPTGEELVRRFQARCPLYGTVAAATPKVEVLVRTSPDA